MASDAEIANVALTLIGDSRILSLDDNTKQAREAKALYTITRDSLLAKYNWSFAKKRTQLPAEATTPPFGYSLSYPLPADCLRVILVGNIYAGLDLTDYRGAPTQMFTIEGKKVLTDLAPPLDLVYIYRVQDSVQFPSVFVEMFACQLAMDLTETLTQSNTKWQRALRRYQDARSDAVRTNAIELPPEKLPDDEWLMSRL